MFDNDDDKTVDKKKDKLILDYDTILKESALLTTFAGILFGFLLDISINTPETFDFIDRVVLIVALFSVTFAASIFIMPVIYHHLEYPYGDLEKFKSRSHRFIMFGLIPAGITLYLGLVLSLSSLLERFPAFLISSIPFILIYVFFRMRK
jgi:uncharacterized protein DUF6328